MPKDSFLYVVTLKFALALERFPLYTCLQCIIMLNLRGIPHDDL